MAGPQAGVPRAGPTPMPTQTIALLTSQLPLLPALVCLLAMGVVKTARAGGGLGAYEGHADIGKPALAGNAQYFADSQEYQVQSSGDDMWAGRDDFHFAWKKVKGDFIIQALTQFSSDAGHPKKKMGLMVRASLDAGSAHVNACRHANGEICLQFRRTAGAATEEFVLPNSGADMLQLERAGGRYTMSAARFGDTYTEQVLDGVVLPDEVYVGIYLCSHDDSALEKAVFKNVRVIRPAAPDFRPYHDYIGSDIELLDVSSGARRSIYRAEDSIQAPNWTLDGRTLVYNHNGRMFTFDLASRRPAPIDTGDQVHCNNDHTLSFDGKMLGISSGSPSIVYTLPSGGGEPKRITPTGPSYLHSWSPDGKYLLFTGGRNNKFDIYRVPSAGGPEERLTTASVLNDGSEYSPDGKTIYFNSNRTGKMQIWRMNADGSAQTQLTDDKYNNWFPHVSPDGKTVLIISFPADINPDDHPFYRRVYLRKMPAEGGKPVVVAYVYGGQGSINVNSWSPDSRSVAFVSNSASF